MANETKKNEGPTCACGKVDLYEEWLKQNEEKEKEKEKNSTPTSQAENKMSTFDATGNNDTKPVPAEE